VLRILRDGDVLVVTRLDRLGRSVLHLVTLGAQLRDRGVGLQVVEQGIDTATAEGRAMFGMLSVLAELQRELIVANTRDGLAAARARGRRGGRPPKLSPDQAALAQRLYDAGEHTVAQIAAMLTVPRSTIYGHLDKATVGTRPHAHKTVAAATFSAEPAPSNDPAGDAHTRGARITAKSRACPGCGHEPRTREEATTQRADLAVTWLCADPHRPGQLLPDNTAAAANPTDPCSTSHVRCAVMDRSSPATWPPRRPTPAPHQSPCSNGWPPTAGNSPRSCCAPTTEPSPHCESSCCCWSRANPFKRKTIPDDRGTCRHGR